jgi:hypothetical protein
MLMKTTWKGFKPDVEEGGDKADVNIEGEYDRLLEVEHEGVHEGIDSVTTADIVDNWNCAYPKRDQ